jgi:hypothetical protein
MIRLLKNLLRNESLPPNIHFHLDERGNEVLCDESVCRPARRAPHPLFPSRW